jgi:DNA-nicking Smr family endonuclease
MARRLDGEEKALWGRVISTVKPMHPALVAVKAPAAAPPAIKQPPAPQKKKAQSLAVKSVSLKPPAASSQPAKAPAAPVANTLDGSWDRRIGRGAIIPDISVDLHGQGLTGAYARLDGALEQAIAQKLRVILLVTGKARTHDRASGQGRGAIASVVRDWLASSRHSASISAVRNSHPRHGGEGALYIVLKR